jgi:hypothetical protein
VAGELKVLLLQIMQTAVAAAVVGVNKVIKTQQIMNKDGTRTPIERLINPLRGDLYLISSN